MRLAWKKIREERSFRVQNKYVRKNKVSLFNVTGNVKITKSDSSNFLIVRAEKIAKVRKRDRDKPLEGPNVTVDTTTDVITISGESKHTGFSFNFGSSRNSVDFDLRIPESIKLTVSNTNGKVELNNAGNDMNISIVNGSLTFGNLSGDVSLDINNGNINGSIDSSKGMELHVINGSVSLTLDTMFGESYSLKLLTGK